MICQSSCPCSSYFIRTPFACIRLPLQTVFRSGRLSRSCKNPSFKIWMYIFCLKEHGSEIDS